MKSNKFPEIINFFWIIFITLCKTKIHLHALFYWSSKMNIMTKQIMIILFESMNWKLPTYIQLGFPWTLNLAKFTKIKLNGLKLNGLHCFILIGLSTNLKAGGEFNLLNCSMFYVLIYKFSWAEQSHTQRSPVLLQPFHRNYLTLDSGSPAQLRLAVWNLKSTFPLQCFVFCFCLH